MTENGAIKELETSIELAKMCTQNSERKSEIEAYNTAIQALEEIQQYRAIGTIEECRTAVERMKPKKVEYFSETFKAYTCPSCETPINNGGMAKGVYCKWCGQKFDWSE